MSKKPIECRNSNSLLLPSPLERVHFDLVDNAQINLFVKRDDLISTHFIGNKFRKLSRHIEFLISNSQYTLVTMGGLHSNHLLSTSYLTLLYGIRTAGFVRATNGAIGGVIQKTISNGMNIYLMSPDNYKLLRETNDPTPFLPPGIEPYFVSEGGFGDISADGCKSILDEIDISFDHLFCACGTGTTLGGIIRSHFENPRPNALYHGVCAIRPMSMILNNILLLNNNRSCDQLILHDEYVLSRFGRPSPTIIDTMKYIRRHTGIELDFNYTGKMFYAIIDLIHKEAITCGQTVVAVHTGGQETAGLTHLS